LSCGCAESRQREARKEKLRDQLEVRGYLDPDRRGDRADERDAIEMFLGDLLNKQNKS
jgi:hypothetical protein